MRISKRQLRKLVREEKSRILQEQKRTVFDMLDDAIALFKRLPDTARRYEVAAAIADLEIVKEEFQAEVSASGWAGYE